MARMVVALGLVVLAATASAGRTIDIVEHAIEAGLADVTMPGSAAGTVILKTCETCEVQSLRVSAETRYLVGSTTLPLADFTREVERIRDGGGNGTLVGVFYEQESGRVTRIKVFANR